MICLLLTGVFFVGKRFGSMESTAAVAESTVPEEPTERNLRISVTSDHDAGFTAIPLEQGNFKDISYLDIQNVTIDIDGTTRKLEESLQGGGISVEELIACARKDASFCSLSGAGLSHEVHLL